MTASPTLTIGIPTFNRRKSVVARVNELFSQPLPKGVDVMVIDNHSDDGTLEALAEMAKGNSRLTVLQNPENLGYAGNFLALLRSAKAEYLMYNSDEDSIVLEDLERFVGFLNAKKPDFVSPQARCHGRIYRGQGKDGPISPTDFRLATFYISGITYRVPSASRFTDFVSDLTRTNTYALLYPQTLLLAALLTSTESFWYPTVMTIKQEQLPTHIRNEKGSSYTAPDARVRQGLDLVLFFDSLIEESKHLAPEEIARIQEMKRAAARRIPGVLRLSISREMPDVLPGFDEGLVRLYKGQSRLHQNISRVKAVVRDPRRLARLFRKRA